MAEVGLVSFARVALRVGRVAFPAYRRKSSKHRFTQLQRLAMLCLMRYEDWTFRGAEVRLAEHRELRAALGLDHVPDDTTLYRFLGRLNEAVLELILSAVVQRLLPQQGPQATVAVAAAGFAPGDISTFFVRRANDRGEGFTWRYRVKWTMAVDVDRRLILAQTAWSGSTIDCAMLRPLVSAVHARAPIGVVLADAECDSERNHQPIRQTLQAHSVLPAKRGGASWRVQGARAQMRQEFPADLYRRRALIESLSSVVKRKPSAHAPGRSLVTQCLQALLLGFVYNIYRLWFSPYWDSEGCQRSQVISKPCVT